MRKARALQILVTLAFLITAVCGCGEVASAPSDLEVTADDPSYKAEPFNPEAGGTNYLQGPVRLIEESDMDRAIAEHEPPLNIWDRLDVPTWAGYDGSTWFLVDCYHNLLLYSNDSYAFDMPLTKWQVLDSELTQPHTIAGDGEVYLADDTENNRVYVFEKRQGKFLHTQTFWDVGTRPHCTAYDQTSDSFYVWSSITGELYVFRKASGTHDVYLTEIRKKKELEGIYVRSFTIADNRIYFVSGTPSEENPSYKPAILCCDLETLSTIESYPVNDSIAGMAQIFAPLADYWLVTVSTDAKGDQSAAALLKASSLKDLSEGKYENIYEKYFGGGGTPYSISRVGSDYFLTEHRQENRGLWRFRINSRGEIEAPEVIY